VPEDRAREELRVIGMRLAQDFPAENANHAPNLRPLRDALVGDVRAIGRATQGVRLIEMEEGDAVVGIAKLAEKEEGNGEDNVQ